jgi:hypothetical protein
MKMDTAQKRLAYQESIWAIKEIDLMEENRKLEMRIGRGLFVSCLIIALLMDEIDAQQEEFANETRKTEEWRVRPDGMMLITV